MIALREVVSDADLEAWRRCASPCCRTSARVDRGDPPNRDAGAVRSWRSSTARSSGRGSRSTAIQGRVAPSCASRCSRGPPSRCRHGVAARLAAHAESVGLHERRLEEPRTKPRSPSRTVRLSRGRPSGGAGGRDRAGGEEPRLPEGVGTRVDRGAARAAFAHLRRARSRGVRGHADSRAGHGHVGALELGVDHVARRLVRRARRRRGRRLRRPDSGRRSTRPRREQPHRRPPRLARPWHCAGAEGDDDRLGGGERAHRGLHVDATATRTCAPSTRSSATSRAT